MKRKDENVVLVEREGGSSVLWFLLGGALGAGLALLFAPHSGDRTRRILGRRITKLRDAADQAFSELKEAIGPGERGGTHRIGAEPEEEGEGDGPSAGEKESGAEEAEPRRGVSAARRELEQRLAEARARRHKALAQEDEEPIA